MSARDLMGVVVRGIGVWFGAQGFMYFCSWVQLTVMPSKDGTGIAAKEYIPSVILHLLVAAVLIGAAEALCDLMYRKASPIGEPPSEDAPQ